MMDTSSAETAPTRPPLRRARVAEVREGGGQTYGWIEAARRFGPSDGCRTPSRPQPSGKPSGRESRAGAVLRCERRTETLSTNDLKGRT